MEDTSDAAPPPTSRWARVRRRVLHNWIAISMLLAIVLGIIVGSLMRLRPERYTKREIMGVEFLGVLFIRVLKALTIPLFMCSVVSALAQLDMRKSRKIGIRTMVTFFVMNITGTLVALVCVLLIRPGSGRSVMAFKKQKDQVKTYSVDSFLDFFRNLFPDNIIGACLHTTRTNLSVPVNKTEKLPLSEWDFALTDASGSNYVGLVAIAVFLGVLMGYLGPEVKNLSAVIKACNDTLMVIMHGIILVLFVGVFCLMVGQMISIPDFETALEQTGLYVLTYCVAVFFVAVVFLPLMLFAATRRPPFRFMYNTLEVVYTAFATSSSLATLPVTITVMEKKNHIHPLISQFVAPLGATVNMAGAGAYLVVAPLFLAQMNAIDLNVGQYLSVFLTATMAAVGVAGIPAGAVVGIIVVLTVLDVPPEQIVIIVGMDWLVDRVVTACNVYSDCVACGIVNHLSRKELDELDTEPSLGTRVIFNRRQQSSSKML